jgi:hypothetical protein
VTVTEDTYHADPDDPRYYRFPLGEPYRVSDEYADVWAVNGDCGHEIFVTVPLDGTSVFCGACFDLAHADQPVRPPLEQGKPAGGPQWARDHEQVIVIAMYTDARPERTWHRVSGLSATLTYCDVRIPNRTPTRRPQYLPRTEGEHWTRTRAVRLCPIDHAGLCGDCFPPRAT